MMYLSLARHMSAGSVLHEFNTVLFIELVVQLTLYLSHSVQSMTETHIDMCLMNHVNLKPCGDFGTWETC